MLSFRRKPESSGEAGEEDQAEKVIVRSNGTVTYVGKDMAYQFWKFGLLGDDLHYRHFGEEGKDGPLWATSSEPAPEEEAERPAFGSGHTIYNVIDVRQSYLQRLLSQALAAGGHPGEAERSIHFSYEMVALSHQTARQLGYSSEAEDAGRPFVEVSGRKGLGVKADDLVDTLVEKALAEVTKRNPELPNDERRESFHIREIFVEAYEVLEPFFDPANAWSGHTHKHLAYRALHERFPQLSTEEVFVFVAAAKRVFGSGGKPVPHA